MNKVSSKVELLFDVAGSALLDAKQKSRILLQLKNKINADGVLSITEQSDRSQHKNKEIVKKRFLLMVMQALKEKKKRVKTKPSIQSKEKRLNKKKKHSMKKELRSTQKHSGE